MVDKSLDLEDYLEAAGDAAQRTRTVTFVLVIGSVLALACLLNSLQSNWMRQRIASLENADSPYSRHLLNVATAVPLSPEDRTHHEAIYNAAVGSYVTTAFTVHVPLLGITFDINDLALLGGFSLLVLLIWFRFAMLREMDNLRIAFREAKAQGELSEMYHLLAMRQVLTMPPMDTTMPGRFVQMLPKGLMMLPALTIWIIFIHDLLTLDIGKDISDTHVLLTLLGSLASAVLVVVLTYHAVMTSVAIDEIWAQTWRDVRGATVASLVPKAGSGA